MNSRSQARLETLTGPAAARGSRPREQSLQWGAPFTRRPLSGSTGAPTIPVLHSTLFPHEVSCLDLVRLGFTTLLPLCMHPQINENMSFYSAHVFFEY